MEHPLEEVLGYRFREPELLRTALTHSSYVNENPTEGASDNERLEYLGDAVLDFLVAEWLFTAYPDLSEGEMTNLRALLVREDTLAHLAEAEQVGQYLLLGKGEEESGGRSRSHNLCAAFEALVGAFYLDAGMDPVRQWVVALLQPEMDKALEDQAVRDSKSLLQEWVQAHHHVTPAYTTVREEGPDHAKVFTVKVMVNGEEWGQGIGRSKQAAAQEAAAAALHHLHHETS
jgi:ribonuclease-3